MKKNDLKGLEDANNLLETYHYNYGVNEVFEFLGGEDYNRNLAVALTLYRFRNGPVEGMHASGKLSEDDMKTLTKSMVDKIGFLLYLFEKSHYLAIDDLLR